MSHARSQPRSGRTKLATSRVAFCALARQGHPRGVTSMGPDFPGHRRLKYITAGSAVCQPFAPAVCGARTGSVGWGLFSGRRPNVRLKRGVAKGRQPHVLGDPWNIGCPVEKTSKSARYQLGTVDPFRTNWPLLIDALDLGVVRRHPCRKIGQFGSKRRIDGSPGVALLLRPHELQGNSKSVSFRSIMLRRRAVSAAGS